MGEQFTVKRVKVQVGAAGALKEYEELLLVLAAAAQEPQLRSAADSFVASLRKGQGVGLSDEKAGAIAASVNDVGELVVVYMQAKAIELTSKGIDLVVKVAAA